ncbi:MAG: GH25 family lysozyme [Johnsonella sp.]|nr:GH25 family lysozyme [Johnsonella sp.]
MKFKQKKHGALSAILNKRRGSALILLALFFLLIGLEAANTAARADIWTSQAPGRYKLFDGSSIDGIHARGIDVSHWQGEIDWKEVAKDDVKFAMIGTGYPNKPDPKFHYNAREAAKAGIALGIYIYSYAENVEQAEAEADYVLNLIKDYPVSYPVAYDIEDETAHGKLSKDELSRIILAFTKKIKDAGYHPMLYASDYWFSTKFDLNALKELDVWVARYHKLHKYNKPAIWQATSEGSIRGIKGKVDINFQYKDFSDIIPKNISRKIAGRIYHYKNYALQSSEEDASFAKESGASPLTQGPGDTSPVPGGPGDTASGQGSSTKLSPSPGQGGEASSSKKGWIFENNTWYYFDQNSRMQTGWIKDKESWYYLGEKGAMQTGWIKDKNSWYYLSSSGAMQTGWIKDRELWYYLDASGRMQTGMLTLGDTRYFLEKDGHMLANTSLNWEGVDYLIESSGALRPGSSSLSSVSLSSPPLSP